eukprot:2973093-Rhodomonas_salina.1
MGVPGAEAFQPLMLEVRLCVGIARSTTQCVFSAAVFSARQTVQALVMKSYTDVLHVHAHGASEPALPPSTTRPSPNLCGVVGPVERTTVALCNGRKFKWNHPNC